METIEQITDKKNAKVILLVNFNALPIKFYDNCPNIHKFCKEDCEEMFKGLGDGTMTASVVCLQDAFYKKVVDSIAVFERESALFKESGVFSEGFRLGHNIELNITNVHKHLETLEAVKASLATNVNLFPVINAEIEKSLTMMIETPDLFDAVRPMGYSGIAIMKGEVIVYPFITEVMYDVDYVKYLSRTIMKKTFENYLQAYPFRKGDMVRKRSKMLLFSDLQVGMNADMTVVTDVFCPYFFETNDNENILNISMDVKMMGDHVEMSVNGEHFMDLPCDIKKIFNIEVTVEETGTPTRISKHGDWFKEYDSFIGLILFNCLYGFVRIKNVRIENILNDLRKYITLVMKEGAPALARSFERLIRKVYQVDGGEAFLPDDDNIKLTSELLEVLAGFPTDETIMYKKDFSKDVIKMIDIINQYV
jgi:hypothetical protein